MLSTRDPPQNRGHIQTENEGLEKDIPRKRDQKKAGVAILISDKIDFKTYKLHERQLKKQPCTYIINLSWAPT